MMMMMMMIMMMMMMMMNMMINMISMIMVIVYMYIPVSLGEGVRDVDVEKSVGLSDSFVCFIGYDDGIFEFKLYRGYTSMILLTESCIICVITNISIFLYNNNNLCHHRCRHWQHHKHHSNPHVHFQYQHYKSDYHFLRSIIPFLHFLTSTVTVWTRNTEPEMIAKDSRSGHCIVIQINIA